MGGHGSKVAQEFLWDVCHEPLWNNVFCIENKTDKLLKVLLEEPHYSQELLVVQNDAKAITTKSESILLSAAFFKREHIGWEDVGHRLTGIKEAAYPPEQTFYVFKRRRKMGAGCSTFVALPRHWDDLKGPECAIENAATLKAALQEYDRRVEKATPFKASRGRKADANAVLQTNQRTQKSQMGAGTAISGITSLPISSAALMSAGVPELDTRPPSPPPPPPPLQWSPVKAMSQFQGLSPQASPPKMLWTAPASSPVSGGIQPVGIDASWIGIGAPEYGVVDVGTPGTRLPPIDEYFKWGLAPSPIKQN